MDLDSGRRPRRGTPLRAWRRLCNRLARQPSPPGERSRPGGEDLGIGARLPASAGTSVSRGRRGCGVRISLPSFEREPGRAGGDSAGGGLVVAAMLAIRESGLAQPACGWCISPWVDMEGIGESMSSKEAADPMVQRAGLLDMAKLYLAAADPRSPLAAPIYAD